VIGVCNSAVQKFVHFSIALDGSTDARDTAQLLLLMRGVTTVPDVASELPSVEAVKDSGGTNERLQATLDPYDLSWNDLMAVTTDGSPT
jgi:hypothetical protein